MATENTESSNDGESYQVECNGVLDISKATEFRGSLAEALDSKLPITLLASGVERADTAILQVLVAFFQDAKIQGALIQWDSPSEILIRSAKLLGLQNTLQLQKYIT